MSNILHIPDLHLPFAYRYALEFVKDVYNKFKCNKVVFGGDVFDQYSWSKYIKDPDSMPPREEFNKAKHQIKSWIKLFPKAIITVGNHDIRLMKRLKDGGVPADILKQTFNSIWELPNTWVWTSRWREDGVTYIHGAKSGEYAHVNTAKDNRQSTVICHTHSTGGVHYQSSYDSTIFAVNSGCLIDDKQYAFHYANEMTRRPVLGCSVINQGIPQFISLR